MHTHIYVCTTCFRSGTCVCLRAGSIPVELTKPTKLLRLWLNDNDLEGESGTRGVLFFSGAPLPVVVKLLSENRKYYTFTKYSYCSVYIRQILKEAFSR